MCYFCFCSVENMFNVSQTNNAILRSNLNRMELLYNSLQKKYSELETKYTSNTLMLNQYMSAFTANTINAATRFSYTLPESSKWQRQSQRISSVIIEDIRTVESDLTETNEQRLIFNLAAPMKYITESSSSQASTKQLQSIVFPYVDLVFEDNKSVMELITCSTSDDSNFSIFETPTLYVTKQTSTTETDKIANTTTTTTSYSVGTAESPAIVVFDSNNIDYSTTCQCEIIDEASYVPKFKSVSSVTL